MIPNFFKGKFFVFEGVDGCGKSKQAGMIEQWIYEELNKPKHRFTAKTNKEPNIKHEEGGAIYADLADENGVHATDPFGFQTWFARDRKKNLTENIIPNLSLGSVVLSDRYCPSMAYAIKNPDADEWDRLMAMQKQILGEDFIWPDAIFIFDISVKTAIARLREKNRELDWHEREPVIKRVRANYLNFASIYPNCHVIGGEGSPEAVCADVKKIILPILDKLKKVA